MKKRILGQTNFDITEVSLGSWQVGGKWGSGFDDRLADSILDAAINSGVNFIDTADVYEMGMSEKAVGRAIKKSDQRIYVATKCGRQVNPHISEGYTPEVLRKYVEDSLTRLQVDCLDLIQLHCPPTEVYYRPEIFGLFDDLKKEGKILNLGVSVEKVEEGLKAIEYENVTTLQVIYNIFRQRPQELLFPLAAEKNVGIIVRVPLASGLLTGKFDLNSTFEKDDHRFFNRNGEMFDKGETFAGIPFEKGLDTVEKLKSLLPENYTLIDLAIQWILSNPHISTIIPGASKPEQVVSNLRAAEQLPLDSSIIEKVNSVYEKEIKAIVHHLW